MANKMYERFSEWCKNIGNRNKSPSTQKEIENFRAYLVAGNVEIGIAKSLSENPLEKDLMRDLPYSHTINEGDTFFHFYRSIKNPKEDDSERDAISKIEGTLLNVAKLASEDIDAFYRACLNNIDKF